MRTYIILITVLGAHFTQSSGSARDAGNQLIEPNTNGIVARSIAATDRSWRARSHYLYIERDEDRNLDSSGLVKSRDVEVSTTILVKGVPFEQLLEHNGLPPTSAERRKQNDQLSKLKSETGERRAAELRRSEEDDTSLIHELPLAFDFRQIGDAVVNGRPAYVLEATPHAGYTARGKYGQMFCKVKGKLWVDKEDFGWVKADGQVTQPFSIGLFLARVLPGSHITMEQARVADGIWMPKHVEIRAAAKIFFIKSLVIDKIVTYSGYQPGGTDQTAIRREESTQ
jgi:hypothetical protein